jgi:hypothetical protein
MELLVPGENRNVTRILEIVSARDVLVVRTA